MANQIFIDIRKAPESLGNHNLDSWEEQVRIFIEKVLLKLGKDRWEISVLFCDDGFIWDLNKEYRKIDNPTDVLSFEAGEYYSDETGEKWFNAGDIVISVDTLKQNSKEFDVEENEELKRLIVHGILHLSGMDHADNSPEQEMLVFQEEILKDFTGEILL